MAEPALYDHLKEVAKPYIEEKYARPVVRGIFDGTLDPAVMRHWLEQDYLYLLDYARAFASLASMAPDDHVATLVDGAHYTLHDELELHRSIAADFDADLAGVTKGPVCSEYTTYLAEVSAHYPLGVVRLLPCMLGFAALGLTVNVPDEPRYRRWVETYSSAEFQGYSARYAAVVNAAGPPTDRAEAVFVEGMQLELAFWDEAATMASSAS